ncbi:MAG: molecular chaperone [Proteobacteria bacterium]|nr:molecular chaperone [Pseudomonadota bacterium]
MIKTICQLFYLLMFCTLTFASEISISPLRLDLSLQAPMATLKVSNPGEQKLLIQTQLMHWTQNNGNDIYQPSEEILVVPPLFSVEPHSHQIIRVALGTTPCKKELSYRLFLKEIVTQKSNIPGLNVALTISIPVFVEPTEKLHTQYAWQASNTPKGVLVSLYNNHNCHLLINELQLLDNKDVAQNSAIKLFKYILPGQSFQWTLPVNEKQLSNYKIKAKINGNDIIDEANKKL